MECFVTTLYGNSQNLPIFGKLKAFVKKDVTFSIRLAPNTTVEVLGGTLDGKTEVTTQNDGTIGESASTIISDGTYGTDTILLLIPKYNIDKLQVDKMNANELVGAIVSNLGLTTVYNTESLHDYLGNVFLTQVRLYGDFDDILDVSKIGTGGAINTVILSGTKYCGCLDKVGKSPLLGIVFPESKNIYLTIENFVAYNRGAGRTTGELNLQWAGRCNVTFNGVQITTLKSTNMLSWTASTITFDGTEISNSDVLE